MITEALNPDGNLTEVGEAVAAGSLLGKPKPLDPDGRFLSVLIPDGAEHLVVDLAAKEAASLPYRARKCGTVHVHDAGSFIGYLAKHGLPETEIWADAARQSLTGVVNADGMSLFAAKTGPLDDAQGFNVDDADGEGTAGWGDHLVKLELVKTAEWKRWRDIDRTLLPQETFAEFIEDNAINVIDPDAASMIEIAQGFYATQSAEFRSVQRLDSGAVSFEYVDGPDTVKGGTKGDLEVPRALRLSIVPFVGHDAIEVWARFRYRLKSGSLSLGVILDNPDRVEQTAFELVAATVRDNTPHTFYMGNPA